MLLFMGSILVSEEDFISLRIERGSNGIFGVLLNTAHQKDFIVFTANNQNEAIEFLEMMANKNNSYVRYLNEKVEAPSLQLRPNSAEAPQGIHSTPQSSGGSDPESIEGGYIDGSPIQDIGPDVVEHGDCEA